MKNLQKHYETAYNMVTGAGIQLRPKNSIQLKPSKAKSYFGACLRKNDEYTIKISEIAFQLGEKEVINTLIHELLHTVEGCFNHGYKWQNYAYKINRLYNLNIARTSSGEGLQIDYKYEIQCQECKNIIGRHKKSKVIEQPENYRCKCGGDFKRIK